jgi:hypothetical protein
MRPHHEADAANRNHCVGHTEIAEHRLAAEGRHDLADHAEAWKNENIHFRMTEEPKQVLVQNGVAAAIIGEECRAEITVGEQHGDRTGQHRQRQQQQEHRYQDGPHEQRHFVQCHTGRAHVEDRRDEVDGAEDRGRAGQMQRQNAEIHRRARMATGRERRV